VLIPIVFFAVPESVHWLARRQPANALQRINAALRRMGHVTVNALPEISHSNAGERPASCSQPRLVATTTIVTLAYFFHVTTFYYIIKWVPKIVVDLGFAASAAAGVLVWVNVGGAIGGTVFGVLTQRISVKMLTIVVLALSTVAVTVFGRTAGRPSAAVHDLCGRRLLHERRHRRPLRDHRAGVSDAGARIRDRVRRRRRPRRIGARTHHCRLPVHGRLFAATVSLLMGLGSLVAAGVLMLLKLEDDRPVAEGIRARN
jgi:hypothetical protein